MHFIFPDSGHLFAAAADTVIQAAERSIRNRGIFTFVLSGGKTSRRLYELLSSPPLVSQMPWNRTHFFWGDERCVLPDDHESNYHMAMETLLSHALVPLENIHRIHAEKKPSESARNYEHFLRNFFLVQKKNKPYYFPSFDCILLGMGVEGHTASLFPGSSALCENERWVVPVRAPEGIFPSYRITLTLPVINQAELVLFLVTGEEKKETAGRVLFDSGARDTLPAAMVRPAGELKWYLDFKI
ncbi:MAG: 6-phosphogluconolactonase [Candidatus Latescibacterota bacterium]